MDLRALDLPQGATALEESLIHETLSSLDPKTAVMVEPDSSVRDAVTTMVDNNIGCVLVGRGRAVIGIFSERDVLVKFAGRMTEAGDEPVRRYMTPNPEMLESSTALAFGLNRMSLGDFRHLPITKQGRFEGILSLRDFLGLLFRWYPDLDDADGGV
ncbi:MAG: CBS domain-containing protein [Acidobacteriota bacterium]|nr:CBS domain-containing protein [Acidobacteriota bacterium]